MASARIVSIALLILSMSLVAQTARQVPLNIRVADYGEASVSGAKVQAHSLTSSIAETKTDEQGNAVLNLEPGAYIVSVSAPGFRSWSTTVQLARNSSHSLKAELQVGGMGSGPVINDESIIQTERQILDVSIPSEPLGSLMDLPGHRLWRFKWSHHPQS
jgi:Carboxypeptidase regulatory-like domain